MRDPNLFKGIAVVIDNGIGRESAIDRIIDNIRSSGGHPIGLLELPAEDYDLEHFARVSFFIMDWNLTSNDGAPLESGVQLPAGLQADMVAKNIAFLKRLSQNRHAPVFIFTNEEPEDVKGELAKDAELSQSVDESHIIVRRKTEVIDKLYDVLESWGSETPSVLTLKTWERGFLKAANELFIDLHNRTPYWPVLLWETFGVDGVPPETEMTRVINRLVEARMAPTDLDLNAFVAGVEETRRKNEGAYQASMHRVLEGERFLRNERLNDNIFAPGDVFAFPQQDGSLSYRMNIRAECDCLRGDDKLELYLLRVTVVEEAEKMIDPKFGTFTSEKDGEAIVYAMYEGKTFSIKFKELKAKSIKQIRTDKGVRLGRLLPPFITRVQQRYAAYVQRPGMPRIPAALYKTA